MASEGGLQNQLKAVRTRLGLSQQELARAAGITRQTIGGIEAALYAPSAAVALRLAKALGCRVEELFWLEEDALTLDAVSAEPLPPNQTLRVTLARIGERWVAHPLLGARAFRTEMIPADGIVTAVKTNGTLSVQLLDEPETLARTVLLAGCAPALSLWARSAERWYPGLRVHWRHANSTEALTGLAQGVVHAAGIHLHSTEGGDDNTPAVRRLFPDRPVALAHLGTWEEGLIVAAGNPKAIHAAADLAREEVRLVNREEGAGSRLLLDSLLREAGIPTGAVPGYAQTVTSHLDVARTVQAGLADVGVSAASVAAAYGLDFVPLQAVRYDLALFRSSLDFEPIQQLLGTLHHRWVRSQLKALGGYDTTQTGEITVIS